MSRPGCAECGVVAWIKDRPAVVLVDLPCFGRPTRLVWHKQPLAVSRPGLRGRLVDGRGPRHRAAPDGHDRPGRPVGVRAGGPPRPVGGRGGPGTRLRLAHLNDAVVAYGAALVDDPDRIGAVAALGLDETLFCRRGQRRIKEWCTSIVDVGGQPAQLLDVVPGRSATSPSAWLASRDEQWREGIAWGVLDLSGPYRKTFRRRARPRHPGG